MSRAKHVSHSQPSGDPREEQTGKEDDFLRAMRLMVEGVKDYAIFRLDREGRIRTWNAGTRSIKGYSAEEIVGQHFSVFYPHAEQEAGRPAAGLETAIREGRYEEEGWRVRKDGTQFMASVVITALYDDRGGVCGFTKVTRDITEQKKQEAVLRESERFMRSLLDAVPFRLAVLDCNARILAGNHAWRETSGDLLGVTPAARLDGASFMDGCREAASQGNAGAAKVIELLGDLLGGSLAEASFEHLASSAGERDWYLCRLVRFSDGGAVRVLISFEDISAIKRAQEKAEREEERFRSLFEYAPDGNVITNERGVITLVNRQTEAMFLYQRDELVGQMVEILMPEEAKERHVGLRQRYLETPVPRPMGAGRGDLYGRRKDGSVFPVDISLSPLESEDGRSVVAGVRDVSARVTSQQQMRQALAMLNAITDGTFMFDPAALRFTYVNQGFARLLGLEAGDLLAMGLADVSTDLGAQAVHALLAPLVDGRQGEVRTIAHLRGADGRAVPVEISFQLVNGGKAHCIGVARDIQERLSREQKERRAQRLESIGTLAGGVAHDLNNALTPVLMACGLLKARHPGSSGLIGQMEAGGQRASEMVRQLLMFARGAEGERVPVDSAGLVKEVLGIVRSTFPKSVSIREEVAAGLWPVICNATQVHQVLLNLCLNARDAMPEGGVLTIEARNGTIAADEDRAFPEAMAGPCVVLTVSDTGAGMSRAVMDRIFEPFFTTKEPDKGTGLGLSTVMGIVRGHGGVIHVESSPGKGSAFSVSIPAAPDEEYAAGAGLRPAMLRGRGETILVVDDEAIVRHVIGTALEEMNFNIVTAGDGREALSVITRLSAAPAVIFVDSQMPAMDGLVFLQNLRQALPDAKAIVMSGHLDERSRATFRNLGAAAILEKPFSLATLATVLRQVLAYGRGSDAENTVS